MPPEIPETRAAAELQWTRPKSAGSWNGGAGCQFKWDSNFLGNTYTQCGMQKSLPGGGQAGGHIYSYTYITAPRLDAPKNHRGIVAAIHVPSEN